MELRDFVIGDTFFTDDGEWLCSDVGSRVAVGIRLTFERIETVNGERAVVLHRSNEARRSGPPYDDEEIVFDEYAQMRCRRLATAAGQND